MKVLRNLSWTRVPVLFAVVAILSGALMSHAAMTQEEPPLQPELKTAGELQQFEKRLQEVVRRVSPAVVKLRYDREGGGGGSGVVFDESGLVLTHGHHKHDPYTELKVVFPDGHIVPAKLVSVYRSQGCDWSLVKIEQPGKWPAVPLHLDGPPNVNEWCFHLGYPGPYPEAGLRLGRVVTLGHDFIRASCTVIQGDSGGPLFNLNGQVIGLGQGSGYKEVNVWTGVCAVVTEEVLLKAAEGDPYKEYDRFKSVVKANRCLHQNHGIPTQPFGELLGPARRATAHVLLDGLPAALGLVVDSNGIVLTKRAEILTGRGQPAGKISCRLHDGETLPAEPIAGLHDHDLALLQVDRKGLPTAQWSEVEKVQQGSLIAAAGIQQETLAVGVVSTDCVFKVNPHRGQHFIIVREEDGGVRAVFEGSDDEDWEKEWSAAWPQIRKGDLITHVDGKPTPSEASYYEALEKEGLLVGDIVRMMIVRDGETREAVFPLVPDWGGRSYFEIRPLLSRRRTGFPAVFGHDAVLTPEQCGGPLIDARGQVVGLNIAREDEHLTLAIPHTVVRPLVKQMLARAEKE